MEMMGKWSILKADVRSGRHGTTCGCARQQHDTASLAEVLVSLQIVIAGLIVGLLVGMTGAGGGALMTPILILLFGVTPSTAVSSDIVASAIMKPFGGAVHYRRGTVHMGLVGWLCVGSVPAAFAGVFIDRPCSRTSSTPWGRPSSWRPAR
jgi:hypothetical protein